MGLIQDFFNGRKGIAGERKVALRLGFFDFFGYKGKCLKNLYVPRFDGSTSEIDLLYITTKGLFVIESKNYTGYIFGDDRAKNWTSTLYGGKTWYGGKKVEKYHFYNPIKQNYSHIKALANYIGAIDAFSFIVFGDQAELKSISISSPGIYVCRAKDLNRILRDIWNREPDRYTESQVQEIYNTLLPLTNADYQVKMDHIQNTTANTNSNICPWCGGNLVIRTAHKGKNAGNSFYGCANYPRCKYTRNI